MITATRLRELLFYDPVTGIFTWVEKISDKVVIGHVAGSINSDGYVQINIFGKAYYAHRLAWLYMKGEWPSSIIDHENLKASDNRWENLRDATKRQNGMNRRAPSNNSSGMKGVSWHRGASKWQSHIRINGRSKYLGLFSTVELAHAAYVDAATKAYGQFARAS